MSERPTVFRQIYLTGAVLAFAASFAPLWVPAADDDLGTDIGTYSLWTVIPADGGSAAVAGVLLVLVLVVTAVVASAMPALGRAVPVILVLLSVIAIAILLAKPDTGSPEPAFGPGAGLMFGTALALGLTAIADVVYSFTGAPARASAEPHVEGIR